MIVLDDVLMGARFLRRLPPLLRNPITPEEARATLRRRLERRDADFLATLQRVMDGPPDGAYRTLLRAAGCEYGDLERLVRERGIEEALRELFRRGVYLTVDELKGRQPIVRGALTLAGGSARFRNRGASADLALQSSGSRGAATFMGLDLDFVRDLGVNIHLLLDAWGGRGWEHAPWGAPGGAALNRVLTMAAAGIRGIRWFSQVDPADGGLHPRYRWSIRALRWGGWMAGVPLPSPTYVPLDDPSPIVRWMIETCERGRTPHLLTSASSAVRVSQAARAMGVDLAGARVTMSGEPVTATRYAEVRRTGAEIMARYGNAEMGGLVACGCLAPEAPDDLHLFRDLLALIQAGDDGAPRGLPPGALMVSSLRASAPFILLNYCLGDQAEVSQRPCGCPFERLGWTTHLRGVRSFEKLTAGGVNLLDSDVIRILEDILPARFGGGPTDYQLVELEDASGRPSLRLRVHPGLGAIDEAAVAEAFLAAISRGSGVERVMGLAWKEGNLLKIERAVPEVTMGKVHHVHVMPSVRGSGREP